MSELHGLGSLTFNWAAADSLVAEFRSTATELDKQIGERKQIGAQARKQWEGSYAQQFDERMGICTGDAQRLADAMRQAADGLQELIDAARQEQQRRKQAQEWVRHHNDRNLLEKAHDWAFGEDGPPPSKPVDPPNIKIHDASARSRGSSVPVCGR